MLIVQFFFDRLKAKCYYAIELASRLQTIRNQIPLRYPASDQLACRPATRLRAGLRAASELDEDLCVHVVCVSQAKFHYAVQLMTSS